MGKGNSNSALLARLAELEKSNAEAIQRATAAEAALARRSPDGTKREPDSKHRERWNAAPLSFVTTTEDARRDKPFVVALMSEPAPVAVWTAESGQDGLILARQHYTKERVAKGGATVRIEGEQDVYLRGVLHSTGNVIPIIGKGARAPLPVGSLVPAHLMGTARQMYALACKRCGILPADDAATLQNVYDASHSPEAGANVVIRAGKVDANDR